MFHKDNTRKPYIDYQMQNSEEQVLCGIYV